MSFATVAACSPAPTSVTSPRPRRARRLISPELARVVAVLDDRLAVECHHLCEWFDYPVAPRGQRTPAQTHLRRRLALARLNRVRSERLLYALLADYRGLAVHVGEWAYCSPDLADPSQARTHLMPDGRGRLVPLVSGL